MATVSVIVLRRAPRLHIPLAKGEAISGIIKLLDMLHLLMVLLKVRKVPPVQIGLEQLSVTRKIDLNMIPLVSVISERCYSIKNQTPKMWHLSKTIEDIMKEKRGIVGPRMNGMISNGAVIWP